MELKEYLEHWKETLSGKGPDPLMASRLKLPLDRLKLYRGFVQNHYKDALTKMFPALFRVAPECFSRKYIEDYYREYPPTHYELNQLSKNFPTFLKSQLKAQNQEPYLGELAEYEWAEFSVYLSKEEEETVLGTLKFKEVTLHPSLYLLNFEYGISDWIEKIRAANPEEAIAPPETKPEILILSRNTTPYEVLATEPSPLALFLAQNLTIGPRHRDSLVKELATTNDLNPSELYAELEFLIEQKVILEAISAR